MIMTEYERALHDPRAVFGEPKEVLAAGDLTADQKHAILESWRCAAPVGIRGREHGRRRGGHAPARVRRPARTRAADRDQAIARAAGRDRPMNVEHILARKGCEVKTIRPNVSVAEALRRLRAEGI